MGTIESVMSIYKGGYTKPFQECEREVEILMDFYEKRLELLRKKKDIAFDDIRMHNMIKSAIDNCYHTVSILNILSRDLQDPKQIIYFKKQLDGTKRITSSPKFNQTKLF